MMLSIEEELLVGQVIVVTSGKGGVGKTAAVANLGCALALLEQKTVLVDLDLGLCKLDLITGISDRSITHLGDVLSGRDSLEEALVPHPHYLNLSILPAPQQETHQSFSSEQMRQLYEQLRSRFDYVLVDCPAGAEQGFYHAICGADRALLVTLCETASVRDGDKIAQLLIDQGIGQIQLIINRYQESLVKQEVLLSIEEVMEALKLPLIGIVPEDVNVIKAGNQGQPIFVIPNAPAALCYQNIARRLTGQEVALARFSKDSLLTRLKKAWKER